MQIENIVGAKQHWNGRQLTIDAVLYNYSIDRQYEPSASQSCVTWNWTKITAHNVTFGWLRGAISTVADGVIGELRVWLLPGASLSNNLGQVCLVAGNIVWEGFPSFVFCQFKEVSIQFNSNIRTALPYI